MPDSPEVRLRIAIGILREIRDQAAKKRPPKGYILNLAKLGIDLATMSDFVEQYNALTPEQIKAYREKTQ